MLRPPTRIAVQGVSQPYPLIPQYFYWYSYSGMYCTWAAGQPGIREATIYSELLIRGSPATQVHTLVHLESASTTRTMHRKPQK